MGGDNSKCDNNFYLRNPITIINEAELSCADKLLLSSAILPITINTILNSLGCIITVQFGTGEKNSFKLLGQEKDFDLGNVGSVISKDSINIESDKNINYNFGDVKPPGYPILKYITNPNNLQVILDKNDGYLFEITLNGIIYQFQRNISIPLFSQDWEFLLILLKDPNPVNTNIMNRSMSINLKNGLEPMIFITSRYLIDYSDIGNTVFKIIKQDKVKNYDLPCIKIVNVLDGKGNTAKDKVENLYLSNKFEIDGLTFTDNIVKYSMSKYFLSKLLYGDFNIKYLLRKYNNKFLKDLKNSEFNNFVEFFTVGELVDYDKYFLCD